MYAYEWDSSTGGYILTPMPLTFSKEPRPVYYKELDILGFDKYWLYDKNDSFPYMWAEANNYYYILHEMIHLHEHLLSFIDSAYRDILFFELYKKINNKIDGIDTLIEAWGNRVNQWEITRLGGIHSPLFLLKSLDIDIEKGYKLGTTLAYGQVDSISKLLKIRK